MDHAITIGMVVWFFVGAFVIVGIAGFCLWLLWVYAQGFRH